MVEIHLEDLANAESQITNPDVDQLDAVVLGCPHASYNECVMVRDLFRGRRVNDNTKFWLITPPQRSGPSEGQRRVRGAHQAGYRGVQRRLHT